MQHSVIINNIKRIMKEKNITLIQLARTSMVPRKVLEDYLEHREYIDSLHRLIRIAEALEVPVDDILLVPGKKVKLTEQEKNFLLAHKHMTQEQKSILMAFLMGCKHAYE